LDTVRTASTPHHPEEGFPVQTSSLPHFIQAWELHGADEQQVHSDPSLSFSASEPNPAGLEHDGPVAVWRLDLPDSLEEARAALDAAERQAAAANQALSTAANSLDTLVRQTAAGSLDEISFSAGGQTDPAILAGLTSTLQRLSGMVTQLACVETASGAHLVGRTRVAWTGDMNTAWSEDLTLDRADLHCRSLSAALISRANLLRMLTLIFQTTTQAAAMISSPVSAIWLLPKAWQNLLSMLEQT
jgi:hypothetical protein